MQDELEEGWIIVFSFLDYRKILQYRLMYRKQVEERFKVRGKNLVSKEIFLNEEFSTREEANEKIFKIISF